MPDESWSVVAAICRSWDGWWEHVQQTIYTELRDARQQAEAAAAEKAQLHAQLRAAARVRPSAAPPVTTCPHTQNARFTEVTHCGCRRWHEDILVNCGQRCQCRRR
jgi:hypothetical protein